MTVSGLIVFPNCTPSENMPTGTLPVENVSSVCLVNRKQTFTVQLLYYSTLIRPPDIHVGELTFYQVHGFFCRSSFLVSYPPNSLNGTQATQPKPATCSEVSAI